jgi:hypothetical protein
MSESPQKNSVLLRTIGCIALGSLTLVVGAAQQEQQAPPASGLAAAQLPAAQPAPQASTDPRRKQLMSDSEHLLSLAVALKAEVDKTNKDMLSLGVIRKADEIEKLAHSVREKMKSAGS